MSPYLSFGALSEISSHFLKAIVGFFQAGMHGAHEYPVLQGREAEIEWSEQVWKGHKL
jgi:hypothetical protein